jgi:hypothetical protein
MNAAAATVCWPSIMALPRIGDRVDAGGVTGEIVAWRGQPGGFISATIRTDSGALAAVTLRPAGAGLAADAAVDMTAAKGLARLILAGKAPPMPINMQLITLAAALLAAGDHT